jgi:hypothetical protein
MTAESDEPEPPAEEEDGAIPDGERLCDYCRLPIPGDEVSGPQDGDAYTFCSEGCRDALDGAEKVFTQYHGFRRTPTGDPEDVVSGAYQRIVYLRERAGRKKAPGETPREFLADADERAKRVGDLYERAKYGPGIDESGATEATRLLAELLEEQSRLPYLLKKRDTKSR